MSPPYTHKKGVTSTVIKTLTFGFKKQSLVKQRQRRENGGFSRSGKYMSFNVLLLNLKRKSYNRKNVYRKRVFPNHLNQFYQRLKSLYLSFLLSLNPSSKLPLPFPTSLFWSNLYLNRSLSPLPPLSSLH